MRRFVYGLLLCGLIARHGVFTETLAEDKSAQPNKVMGQQVIAEGVGTTPDEAIKDAFRNAVRQVVGAVVDAETLVKNDEIIDDKVLTYSDGFIKGYEEVVGSKKVKGGLHRIKIKAQVERLSVIAKLRAANVIVKEVDGKGLFAEAVTQLEAEMDAAALLKKQFEGFPQSCIRARVIGKPELLERSTDQVKVKLTVIIEPDLKAFKAFAEKMTFVLDKIAKSNGEITIKYNRHASDTSGDMKAIGSDGKYLFGKDILVRSLPKLFSGYDYWEWKEGHTFIAIATSCTKVGDSIDYKYYALDASLETVLREVALQVGECKLQLRGNDCEVIVTDRFDPFAESDNVSRSFFRAEGSFGQSGTVFTRKALLVDPQKVLIFLGISPVFGDMATQRSKLTISRTLNLGLDELQSVKDTKVEIIFND